MALFEKCWLFNEKHCCQPGEVAFTTAWIAPAQRANAPRCRISAGLIGNTLRRGRGNGRRTEMGP